MLVSARLSSRRLSRHLHCIPYPKTHGLRKCRFSAARVRLRATRGCENGTFRRLWLYSDSLTLWRVVMSIELLGSLVVLGFLAFMLPMRCQGAIARPPFRGCCIRVYGFLGHCRNHGFQPQRRMMSALGGQRLAARRTCSSCGRPAVFCRRRDTGRPFLGWSGFPECKNPRWLGN